MILKIPPIILVIVAAVIGGLVAGYWAGSQDEQYEATAVAAIGPAASLADDREAIDVVGGLDRTGIAATAAGIAESRSLRDEAAGQLGVEPRALRAYTIDGVAVVGASLVDVVVTGPDPTTTAELANAAAAVLQERIAAIYRIYQLEIVTAAVPPTNQTRPSTLIVVAAGSLAAAALAGVVVYAAGSGRRARRRSHRIAA